MTDLFVTKTKTSTGYGLLPAHQEDLDAIKKLPNGQPMLCKITRIRNVGHHRKYMALLNHAFHAWEMPECEIEVEKDFDEFRKNIAILAGWRKQVIDIRGNWHYRAKSISFTNMDQDEFEKLYTKTIDVLVKRVLTNYTGDELRRVIDEILAFE